MNMTLSTDYIDNGGNLQFTLTCISTGGPATTVTWTRDSVTVTEGTQTVLNDPETAQYTHTLTETGSLGVNYTCTVTNNKPSTASATYIVQGISQLLLASMSMTLTPGQPVIESGEITATTISISWSVPSGFVAEYYEIEWSSHKCPGAQTQRNAIMTGAATNFTIPELRAGTEYNVLVIAINPAGNFTTNVLSIHTLEMGECIAGMMHIMYPLYTDC